LLLANMSKIAAKQAVSAIPNGYPWGRPRSSTSMPKGKS
jgi:hypothetical protein